MMARHGPLGREGSLGLADTLVQFFSSFFFFFFSIIQKDRVDVLRQAIDLAVR